MKRKERITIKKNNCIAILRDIHYKDALEIVDVLIETGFKKVEVSLSNEEIAYDTLEKLINNLGDKIEIGAGTVTSIEQVKKLKEIGVKFIITPAYNPEVIKYCTMNNIKILPGVFSPSEIMNCIKLGVNTMKLFPANAFDYNYINSIKGPFPQAEFYAVGGVNIDNLENYINSGFKGVAIGNSLVKRGSTKEDLSIIRNNAKRYMEVLDACN